jgi:hypothetical protein
MQAKSRHRLHVTNRRVAMRIGAALTMTLNLPYTQIANANLDLRRRGTGTIALEMSDGRHAPVLPCVLAPRPALGAAQSTAGIALHPEAAKVAQMLADAAETRVFTPRVAVHLPRPWPRSEADDRRAASAKEDHEPR